MMVSGRYSNVFRLSLNYLVSTILLKIQLKNIAWALLNLFNISSVPAFYSHNIAYTHENLCRIIRHFSIIGKGCQIIRRAGFLEVRYNGCWSKCWGGLCSYDKPDSVVSMRTHTHELTRTTRRELVTTNTVEVEEDTQKKMWSWPGM